MILPFGGSTERQWHVWESHLFQKGQACWLLMMPRARLCASLECGPQHWVCLQVGLFRQEDSSWAFAPPLLLRALCPWEPRCAAAPHLPTSQEDVILIFRLCRLFVLNPALYRQFFLWTRNSIYGLKNTFLLGSFVVLWVHFNTVR